MNQLLPLRRQIDISNAVQSRLAILLPGYKNKVFPDDIRTEIFHTVWEHGSTHSDSFLMLKVVDFFCKVYN